MSDDFRVTETADGIAIHLDRSVMLGFLSILIDAKFQPGLRWEVLLTPWIKQIIEAIESRSACGSLAAPGDIQPRVEKVIDGYIAAHPTDESRDELLRIALLPFRPV